MAQKWILSGAAVLLLVLATLVVWQGSFSFGDYGPASSFQLYLFWAVSTLVFLLTVILGFMLFRTGLRIYIERQTNREGSRLRTKLVVGALALTFLPVVFAMLFSVNVLNRNLDKWFSRPTDVAMTGLTEVGVHIHKETRDRVEAQARWLAASGSARADACKQYGFASLAVNGEVICRTGEAAAVSARFELEDGREVRVDAPLRLDLAKREAEIRNTVSTYKRLHEEKREFRQFYIRLLVLICLFILFFAAWIALFLAKQISVPISELLKGVLEVRGGNLSYRVGVKAIDELALLVRAFNDMTQALEVNGRELERRRRFTEAILENVPAGVISLSADGRILLTNRALGSIFAPESLNEAAWLEDLFPRDDAAEIRYLMNRARRTGIASRQFELERDGQTLHLAVTVSALEGKENAGYVLVIEDTSELLRAQRASAWQEVARRIAHEIKNPLTPIALSAERITRTLERQPQKPEAGPSAAVLRECAALIVKEVQSLRTLVDEFAQFSRFPAAQPRPVSLNDVVREGLAVFESRLEEIEVVTDLAPDLPPLPLDPDQIKRVVVNLVDNAAEAMRDQPLRRLWITTQAVTLDSVELCVADTGCGVSAEDRERLFLPYFSTKGRGTGLGLAIVSHILAEHGALIRVEDNEPAGARFVIEFAAPVAEESPVAAS